MREIPYNVRQNAARALSRDVGIENSLVFGELCEPVNKYKTQKNVIIHDKCIR